MIKRDYNNYDYITVSVKEEKYDPVIRCYEKLGWERVKSREDAVYYNLVTVVFRRPHKIMKKDRLQLLQVWMESQINEISTAGAEKHAVSVSAGIILYLIYSALVVCGVLMAIFAKTPTFAWIGVALAVLGVCFSAITIAPLYKRVKRENGVYEERFDRASRELESYIEEADALAYERQLYETAILNSQNEQFEEQLNQSLFEENKDGANVDETDVDDGVNTDEVDGDLGDEQAQETVENGGASDETSGENAIEKDGETQPENEQVAERENVEKEQSVCAAQPQENERESGVESENKNAENAPESQEKTGVEDIEKEEIISPETQEKDGQENEEKEVEGAVEKEPEKDDSQGIFAHEIDFDDQNVQVLDSTCEVVEEEIETFVADEEYHVDGEVLELTIEEKFDDQTESEQTGDNGEIDQADETPDNEKTDQADETLAYSVDEQVQSDDFLDGAPDQTDGEQNKESGVIDNE